MQDTTTSYKFVGGKLVARTAEEHAKLVELRKAASHNKPCKPARSKESFIMITQAHSGSRWGRKPMRPGSSMRLGRKSRLPMSMRCCATGRGSA